MPSFTRTEAVGHLRDLVDAEQIGGVVEENIARFGIARFSDSVP